MKNKFWSKSGQKIWSENLADILPPPEPAPAVRTNVRKIAKIEQMFENNEMVTIARNGAR
jgi:hypothetical protein